MKTVIVALLLAVATPALAKPPQVAQPVHTPPAHPAPAKAAGVCSKIAEAKVGTEKICMYNCTGSQASVTIKASQSCSPTIKH